MRINGLLMLSSHIWKMHIFANGNELCVPDFNLHLKIVKELHDEGHLGRDKIYALVSGHTFGRLCGDMFTSLWLAVIFAKYLRVQLQMQVCTCHCPFHLTLGPMSVWILCRLTAYPMRQWFCLCDGPDGWSVLQNGPLHCLQKDCGCCQGGTLIFCGGLLFAWAANIHCFWPWYSIPKSLLVLLVEIGKHQIGF